MGSSTLRRVWRYAQWALLALILVWILLAIYRIPTVELQKKSAAAVSYIESQKLTMADVDGAHLPLPPDPKHRDSTIQGIDVNQNGIRDDVELAIFAKYPNDIRLRAAALQYAMTEQMFLTFVVDTASWKAVAEQNGRANLCLISLNLGFKVTETLIKYIDSLVLNTDTRKNAYENAFAFTTSHGDASGQICDVQI